MVVEAGLALVARQRGGGPDLAYGVVTPGTAMGPALVERLHNVGIEFKVRAAV
jgi:short subunit dehydrogenase-like uncharacterized protein